MNWSTPAAHTTDENLLGIHSPQLAKHFARGMDRLWGTAELGITAPIHLKLDSWWFNQEIILKFRRSSIK